MKPQMTDTGLDLGKWLGGAAAGAAAGALLMYMLDPDRGSARRAQSGEKLRSMGKQAGEAVGGAWEKVGSRFAGATEEMREGASRLAGQAVEAVRPDGHARSMGESMSRMGHSASESIKGSMHQASEAASRAAGRMRGAMQGMGGEWAPATRNSAMVGGGLLGLYGLLRRSPLGMAVGVAGLALLARGIANQPLRGMVRGRMMGQTIDLEKSIRIDASPEEVYDLWANYENFPKFMSHVMEVRDLGHRRSHWAVRGPGGTEFEWDSVLTEQSRPYRLAWRSEPGAEIAQTGSVQFEPWRGGTRVTVRMSYSPPAGALGHGLAVLLGADPKRQMDDDLARMKAFIERGTIPHEAAQQGGGASRFLH